MKQRDSENHSRSFIPLAKGTIVSHYRIVEKIGAGGMGEVYLAEDIRLDRKVALKFLPHHLCQDDNCLERFKREAQAAAKLNHQNIITIYEVSDHEGRPYFAMEHVEGRSLREMIKSEELSTDQAVDIVTQVCEGLQAAHDEGIVHRDIKPSNIFIDVNGRCRILDFGLAAVQSKEKLTKSGSSLGTVSYMSPEQVRGEKIDHRSDIFSVGVMLYEMITGRLPFKGELDAAVVYSIINDTPEPLARYKSDIPDRIQQNTSKMLEKDREIRYQHVDDLIADLKRLVMPGQSSIVVQPGERKSRWPLSIAGYVIVATLIVIGINYWRADDSPSVDSTAAGRKMLAVLPFENLGNPEDEYFADGITDEIASRLAKLLGLGVISRTSTMRYKVTEKTLPQIAEELGVSFVLVGTIRWDKSAETDRVRITPQLINAIDNTNLWAENYERDMTDIFSVQADIAAQIASALDITLFQPERNALAAKPTESLDAYHKFLQGQERLWLPDYSEDNFYMAVIDLERAIDLDPDFALAYAALSEAHSLIYHFGYDKTTARLNRAKETIFQALELRPDLPEVHFAYGEYYYMGCKDYEKALGEYILARKGLQDDYRVVSAIGFVHRRQGKFEEAVSNLEKALELSPREPVITNELGWTLTFKREYPAAERFFKHSIDLAPVQQDAYSSISWLYWLWKGDLPTARTYLKKAPNQNAANILFFLYLQHLFERDYQGAIDWLQPVSIDIIEILREAEPKILMMADCYRLMDKTDQAISAYDSALTLLENKVTAEPDDFRYHLSLGRAYAGLDRKEEAIRELQRSLELIPVSMDFLLGTATLQAVARIHVMIGDYENALNEIEYLLSVPSLTSVSLLQIDPRWDPLRNHPRFQAIIEKYEKEQGL